MKNTLALLPLDDRPVNYDAPRGLARMAGCELRLPPRDWLGNPWREGRPAALAAWLEGQAPAAQELVVAIDTLGYGGLVASRTSCEPAERVLERLEVLRRIKSSRPGLPILAFNVIQRVSRDNSSEEEKDYWAVYGGRLFRLSYLEHKAALGEAAPEEITESARLRAQIPPDVYGDYRQGRARNHAVNQAMLDWLG